MTDITDAIIQDREGIIILLDVSANSRADQFPAGYNEWRKAIGCLVKAPPVGGRANKSIIRCVAGALGVPKSQVSIISGTTASSKRVLVTGITLDTVKEKIESLL